jgi:hypothetical protein
MQITNNAIDLLLIKNECESRIDSFSSQFGIATIARNSSIVTLINLLAYIDLNPIRAGIVTKPEDYRWSSLGCLIQTGNRDKLISLDRGLPE